MLNYDEILIKYPGDTYGVYDIYGNRYLYETEEEYISLYYKLLLNNRIYGYRVN